jgi:hypothetical protein
MDIYQNPKVIGAFLVGFALVAGAYVVANFGKPRVAPVATAVAAEAPNRVFIPVADNDLNGVEDWQDQFVTAPAVTLQETTASDYIPPNSFTGQLGVSLMEGVIMAKGAAPITRDQGQVIADTVEKISQSALTDTIYDVKDIIVSQDSSDIAVRTYGNSLASVLIGESRPDLENELLLLQDYLTSPDSGDPEKLNELAQVYKSYRDKTLIIPVPKQFVKPHLDLINVYHAMYTNIDAMTKATADPLLPFARLKRYEDDALGLSYALGGMYNALVPYARVFEMNDPAIVFVNLYRTTP